MDVLVSDVLRIYEKEVKLNTKRKDKIYRFERNKMQNIMSIVEALRSGNYNQMKYNIFMINSPKYRIVMSLEIKDKVINHYITRHILMPKLSHRLSNRNVATREGMGRDYALDLVLKDLEGFKKEEIFYILKMDISKYFYSIDHEVLKGMTRKYLTNEEYSLLCHTLNSTNEEYINRTINKLKEKVLTKITTRIKEVEGIPNYLKGKGLPIGNMSSQFLSIYYLNELDHQIIHDFHITHYVRYMDDMVLISKSKEKLKDIANKIEEILNIKYCLKVNKNKTKLTNSKEGFVFCGYRFRVIGNKTITNICSGTKKRVKKRLKELSHLQKEGMIELHSLFSSIKTYEGGFSYGSHSKMIRMVERYFYDRLSL